MSKKAVEEKVEEKAVEKVEQVETKEVKKTVAKGAESQPKVRTLQARVITATEGEFYAPLLKLRDEEIELMKGKSGAYLQTVLTAALQAVQRLRGGVPESIEEGLVGDLQDFLDAHVEPAKADFFDTYPQE